MSAFEEPTVPKGPRQRKQGKSANSTVLKPESTDGQG